MAVRPVTGMLRRNLVLDLGIALVHLEEDASETLTIRAMWLVGGNNGLISIIGSGFAMANVFWYGFHMPRTNARDNHYIKLEAERAAAKAE
ncbi:hypothetical protein BKA56DRAFT_669897 [Ilyonectria sp. MPI-CAGE-AT-0026]|nr:hypothetical protein BKA56DRAFT_669897 [Ilyonectria sp. MPI-CAGE-AT-0026]